MNLFSFMEVFRVFVVILCVIVNIFSLFWEVLGVSIKSI